MGNWECFQHLAPQLEEITAFLCLSRGSIRNTEMVESENLDLVPNVTDFQDVSWKKLHFICYQLVTRRSSQIIKMIEAENLGLVASGRNSCC